MHLPDQRIRDLTVLIGLGYRWHLPSRSWYLLLALYGAYTDGVVDLTVVLA